GLTQALIREIPVYSSTFTGGVNLAVGNVRAEAGLELVVAPSSGKSTVKIFSVADGTLLNQFQATSTSYTSGVRVTTADVAGDSLAEVVTVRQKGKAVVSEFDATT